MDEFVVHGCEQVLRFSRVGTWGDLSEERKVQLGFNLGAVAHGLDLKKEESFSVLSDAREGKISMQEFREKMRILFEKHKIPVSEEKIMKPF